MWQISINGRPQSEEYYALAGKVPRSRQRNLADIGYIRNVHTCSHIGQIRSLIDHFDPDQSQIMVICAAQITRDIFPPGNLCAQITRDIFPTGDLCAQITRDTFPTGDLCAQITRDIFPTGDLCAQITRDIFPTGDLCAKITRDIFPPGDLCAQVTCVPQITS